MLRLFFNVEGQFRRYTVLDYKLDEDFYEFTDTIDGLHRRLHKRYFTGQEEVKQ